MKVEAGESLILSWLRHVKKCQVVQLNWKPSGRWAFSSRIELERVLTETQHHFRNEFNIELFNRGSHSQLIKQCEIDVLGIHFGDAGRIKIFAVDIANHDNGLHYGPGNENLVRVLKKLVRSAAAVRGYFPAAEAEILFTSPKINERTVEEVSNSIQQLSKRFEAVGWPFQTNLICNESFLSEIVEPVISCSGEVADTSELFLRSYQLRRNAEKKSTRNRLGGRTADDSSTESRETDDKDVVKCNERVGEYVRRKIDELISSQRLSNKILSNLQDVAYCKQTFGLAYPLLKAYAANIAKPNQHLIDGHGRFWVKRKTINAQEYYVCSQWYDDNRGKFDRWLDNLPRE